MAEKGESFYTVEDLRNYVSNSEEYTAITGRDRVGDGETPFPDPIIENDSSVNIPNRIIKQIPGQINFDDVQKQIDEVNQPVKNEDENIDKELLSFYRRINTVKEMMKIHDDSRSLFFIPNGTEVLIESKHTSNRKVSRLFNAFTSENFVVRHDLDKKSKFQTIGSLGKGAWFKKYESGGQSTTVHFSLFPGQKISMLRGSKEGTDYFDLKKVDTFEKFNQLVSKKSKA